MEPSSIDQAIFRKVGRPAVFTPLAGAPVNTFAIVEDHTVVEDYQVDVVDGGAILTALQSDVGRPVRGDVFAVDSKSWTVERPLHSTDPSLIELVCRET